MQANRKFAVPNSLILGAIGISAIAAAGLLAFPSNLLVWQLEAWTLAIALLALLALVPISAYSLVVDRTTRTWQRIVSVSLGLTILVAVAIASL